MAKLINKKPKSPISAKTRGDKGKTMATSGKPPQKDDGSPQDAETLFDIAQSKLIYEGEMEVATIRANFHPSMKFSLQPSRALKKSVAEHGVEQSLLIEERDGQYIIRAGKRRFLSAEMGKRETVLVRVKSFPFGMGAKIGIETNTTPSRNPVDEYHQLLELEESLSEMGETPTAERLAELLGMTVPAVRKMRCIETMPEPVQTAINDRKITIENAYQLAKIVPSKQKDLINQLEEGGRVTGKDIKKAKMVVREEVKQDTLPSLDISEARSDIPRLDVIREVTELRFPKMTKKLKGEVADFIYALMTQPTKTISLVYKRLGEKEND